MDRIRNVVCVHRIDRLGTRWMRAYQRLRAGVAQARLNVRVDLLPAEALPSDADIVLTLEADGLQPVVAAAAPAAQIVVTPVERASAAIDALIADLKNGTRGRVDVIPADDAPPRTVYRGIARIQ